jgi:hypothetical protein
MNNTKGVVKMIEFKKIDTGYFRVYVDGVETEYDIRIASHPSNGRGKAFYDAYKGAKRLNDITPSFKLSLNLNKAKDLITKEINK